MDQQEIKYRPIENLHSSGQVKTICQNMIRKDLEIFRIQDLLFEVFREPEFYSRCDDEFLSVDHTIQLAFGRPIEELDQTLVGVIQDCTMALAFDYRTSKTNFLTFIDRKASFLAEQIFSVSEIENTEAAILNFITAVELNYPHLDIWGRLSFVKHLKPQLIKGEEDEKPTMANLASL